MRGLLLPVVLAAIGGSAWGDDAENPVLSSLRPLLEERKAIRHGMFRVRLTHHVAALMLQSYDQVAHDIECEFDADAGYRRQIVNLSHPNWNRRTVTLRNSQGQLHDAGGNSLCGVYASPGNEAGNEWSQPDAYDFRMLGLRFPSNALAYADGLDDRAMLGWAARFDAVAVDVVDAEGEGREVHFSCLRSDGVDVLVVCKEAVEGNPVLVRESLDANSIETTMEYASVAIAQGDGDDASVTQIWFPSRLDYRVFQNGVLGYHESIDVLECDFTTRPPESRFDVATLGLARGRRVLGDNVQQMVIDDSGLRRATASDLMNADNASYTIIGTTSLEPREPRLGTRGVVLIVVNMMFLLTLFAVVLLRRKAERKRVREHEN